MTFRDGDTIYPHHPDTVPAGDYCVNSRPGDVWYLVVDELEQLETSWHILAELLQGTAWHIYPFIIPYIAQFVIKYVESEFRVSQVISDFKLYPIQSNFIVERVIDDNVSIKYQETDTSFKLVPVTYTFSLRQPITSNFKITRVINSTRTP